MREYVLHLIKINSDWWLFCFSASALAPIVVWVLARGFFFQYLNEIASDISRQFVGYLRVANPVGLLTSRDSQQQFKDWLVREVLLRVFFKVLVLLPFSVLFLSFIYILTIPFFAFGLLVLSFVLFLLAWFYIFLLIVRL